MCVREREGGNLWASGILITHMQTWWGAGKMCALTKRLGWADFIRILSKLEPFLMAHSLYCSICFLWIIWSQIYVYRSNTTIKKMKIFSHWLEIYRALQYSNSWVILWKLKFLLPSQFYFLGGFSLSKQGKEKQNIWIWASVRITGNLNWSKTFGWLQFKPEQ